MHVKQLPLVNKAKRVFKPAADIQLGTSSITEVRREPTDPDKDIDDNKTFRLETQTHTFSRGEPTDSDRDRR